MRSGRPLEAAPRRRVNSRRRFGKPVALAVEHSTSDTARFILKAFKVSRCALAFPDPFPPLSPVSGQDAATATLVEVLRRLPPPRRRAAASAAAAPDSSKAPPPLPDEASLGKVPKVAGECGTPEAAAVRVWELALARGPRPAEVRAPLHGGAGELGCR